MGDQRPAASSGRALAYRPKRDVAAGSGSSRCVRWCGSIEHHQGVRQLGPPGQVDRPPLRYPSNPLGDLYMATRSTLGCLAYGLLVILAVWLMLLMTDSPELDYFARAWPIVRDLVASILASIWHFLGG
jgi:hypothetical protein